MGDEELGPVGGDRLDPGALGEGYGRQFSDGSGSIEDGVGVELDPEDVEAAIQEAESKS